MSPRRSEQPRQREHLGEHHDGEIDELAPGWLHAGQRQRAPPSGEHVGERLEHPHAQQFAGVEEADPLTVRGERPCQRDVLDHLAADGLHRAGGTETPTLERRALAVGHHAVGCARWCAGRTEAVDERGEHRRVQEPTSGRRAVEAPGDTQEVEPVARRPRHERRREPWVGSGVGVEGDHPLRRCRRNALLERPGLAGPAVGKCGTAEHGRSRPSCDVRGAVARLVVDDDHLAHPWCADDCIEQWPDAAGLVTRGHDDADRLQRCECGTHRGRDGRRPHQAGHRHGTGGQSDADRDEPDPSTKRAHERSTPERSRAIISVTILALVVTSGRPPPGWLDPPTRYSPGRAPRFAGRTNAARRPLDDVP